MAVLEVWDRRPTEEANLFNPAFIGSLTFEMAKEYEKSKPEGVPLTFVPLVLSIVLHQQTRERLPSSTVSSLYEWMQNNEDVLIGFWERVCGLLPYVREAMLFSLQHQTIRFSEGHLVRLGEKKGHFSAGFMRATTQEVKDVIDGTKFMARWFAKSGSESSILACWGIKP
ncbi:hypothetical protein JCM17844_29170 [Iodidimonas gelatinilytica]|uniref:Uncharacterized protein n=1 Tax=Iodidimonas gelatinilytica TaxID=1236966 RepID=A0A5A7MTN4_9PROT|nr:three component ABC system middle component [Iodidimonas gelatinilytica]GEQ99280.1 hypothetical protein JCM17844_29170 [Iodidimonas gelatinilytica]